MKLVTIKTTVNFKSIPGKQLQRLFRFFAHQVDLKKGDKKRRVSSWAMALLPNHALFYPKFWGSHGGVHSHGDTPIAGWFIMDNPIEMDNLGVPPYWETSIWLSLTCFQDLKPIGTFYWTHDNVDVNFNVHSKKLKNPQHPHIKTILTHGFLGLSGLLSDPFPNDFDLEADWWLTPSSFPSKFTQMIHNGDRS